MSYLLNMEEELKFSSIIWLIFMSVWKNMDDQSSNASV